MQITITGSNFGDEQGSGTVKVADKEAAVVSWSVGEIVCTLPQGLSESGGVAVKVTTDSGKAASSQIEITSPNTYRVTIDHAMDQYPCWSGNDRIYFSSTRSGGANWDIYYIPSTGGKAERVTSDDAPDFYPAIRQSSGELAWSSQMRHVNNTEGDYEIFYGFPRCDGPGGACTVAMLTSNESRDLDPTYATTIYSGYYMASTYEEVDGGDRTSPGRYTCTRSGRPSS